MIKSYGYDTDPPTCRKAREIIEAIFDKDGPLRGSFGFERKYEPEFLYCECGSTAFHGAAGSYIFVIKCVNCGAERVAYDG